METFNTNHEGKGPHLTKEELRKELPHGGVKEGFVTDKLTDEARERVAAAIDASSIVQKEETQNTGGDAYNSGSTYKPQ